MVATKEEIGRYILCLEIGSLIDVRVKQIREDYGESCNTKVLKAVVEDKLPFLIKTNRGYFSHKDIYYWNHGGYKYDR